MKIYAILCLPLAQLETQSKENSNVQVSRQRIAIYFFRMDEFFLTRESHLRIKTGRLTLLLGGFHLSAGISVKSALMDRWIDRIKIVLHHFSTLFYCIGECHLQTGVLD